LRPQIDADQTGGDSAPVVVAARLNAPEGSCFLVLSNPGRNPLYNVRARLVEHLQNVRPEYVQSPIYYDETLKIPELDPRDARVFKTMIRPTPSDVYLVITDARNGKFRETLTFRNDPSFVDLRLLRLSDNKVLLDTARVASPTH
jgi:hypothetical protein